MTDLVRNQAPVISQALLDLVNQLANSFCTAKELMEKIIQQADAEGVPIASVRELITHALHKRGLADRSIRLYLPARFKDQVKVRAAKASHNGPSHAASIAAPAIDESQSYLNAGGSTASNNDSVIVLQDMCIRDQEEISRLQSMLSSLLDNSKSANNATMDSEYRRRLEEINKHLVEENLQLREIIEKTDNGGFLTTRSLHFVPQRIVIAAELYAPITTFIGNKAFAIGIHTQGAEATSVDWLDADCHIVKSCHK